MTEQLVRPALRAILEAIDGIEHATRGKTIDDFSADWLLRHGVQRGIEIISEAARRIPPDLQATQPHVPWPQIMGIGNVLRHEYHRISDAVVWNVVTQYLPSLKAAVAAIDANLDEKD
ncbi:MAG: HepT-like ribonuclease domain-containing protein [Stellaceae bacterium]